MGLKNELLILLLVVCTIIWMSIFPESPVEQDTESIPQYEISPIGKMPLFPKEIIEETEPPYQLEYDEINNYEFIFGERRDNIVHNCRTSGLSAEAFFEESEDPSVDPYMDMMINPGVPPLAWCPIYKAGSTIWKKNFAILSGDAKSDVLRTGNSDPLDLDLEAIIQERYTLTYRVSQMKKRATGMATLMVVRHPFERLLSAYRHKLENRQGEEYYYERFGKRIVEKYRQKSSNHTQAEPTFAEFLNFIVDEQEPDDYWTPYNSTCYPCTIKYDYVMKFENLVDEYNYYLFITGMHKHGFPYPLTPLPENDPKSSTSQKVKEYYFKQVPTKLLRQVYEIYKLDFILFEYHPDEYYSLSMKDSDTESDVEVYAHE
ncbi:hypothetical protein TKK_0014896 [Trichogramma kaykai]